MSRLHFTGTSYGNALGLAPAVPQYNQQGQYGQANVAWSPWTNGARAAVHHSGRVFVQTPQGTAAVAMVAPSAPAPAPMVVKPKCIKTKVVYIGANWKTAQKVLRKWYDNGYVKDKLLATVLRETLTPGVWHGRWATQSQWFWSDGSVTSKTW